MNTFVRFISSNEIVYRMKDENKTLVILSPAFPATESESYWVPSQQLLVKSLKENFPGLNIIVLAYFYPHQRSVYEWHGVKVISLNGIKSNRLILFARMWHTLKKIKKELPIIGIISFWYREGAFIGKLFSKRYGLKHFCWICGQDARKTNKYAKWISPKSNELVAISDFIKDEFYKNHLVNPAHIIPNAIVPGLFPAAFSQERDIDLLAVGSLVPLKQFDIFISVIKKLIQNRPGIKALICGSGQEKENLKSLIGKFNLNRNISLLEAISHEEVFKLMQSTKILLHPSNYEGFSTVCLEAIYAGAHVISFTKPMNYEIKNWHVVTTEEEMGKKSLALLQDIHLTHERVLAFDMNDSAKKFMKLFD